MLLNKHREIILIYGKTGSGKSELAKRLIKPYNRIVIIDVMNEYEGTIVETFDDFIDYIIDRENFVVCVRFTDDEDYEFLFRTIFEVSNILLVLEEAELYISPSERRNEFLKLVKYGRHRDISIIGIARRISELSPQLRSQVDKIYTFKQTEPKDLKVLKELGFNENKIMNLNDFEYEVIQN